MWTTWKLKWLLLLYVHRWGTLANDWSEKMNIFLHVPQIRNKAFDAILFEDKILFYFRLKEHFYQIPKKRLELRKTVSLPSLCISIWISYKGRNKKLILRFATTTSLQIRVLALTFDNDKNLFEDLHLNMRQIWTYNTVVVLYIEIIRANKRELKTLLFRELETG